MHQLLDIMIFMLKNMICYIMVVNQVAYVLHLYVLHLKRPLFKLNNLNNLYNQSI